MGGANRARERRHRQDGGGHEEVRRGGWGRGIRKDVRVEMLRACMSCVYPTMHTRTRTTRKHKGTSAGSEEACEERQQQAYRAHQKCSPCVNSRIESLHTRTPALAVGARKKALEEKQNPAFLLNILPVVWAVCMLGRGDEHVHNVNYCTYTCVFQSMSTNASQVTHAYQTRGHKKTCTCKTCTHMHTHTYANTPKYLNTHLHK